jgi:hypothetical protein
MLLPHNPLFVGRAGDLRTLAEAFKAGGSVPTVAITGIGGMGKTQLAAEFVHRYGRYFAGGVFWLSFAVPEAIPAEVAACPDPDLRALRAPSFDDLPLEQQVRLVRESWQRPLPRLLIFDNCEDEELLDEWRPKWGATRVLVTSRRATWARELGVRQLPLEAPSTHVKGAGTYEPASRLEAPRIQVTLATGIPEERCRRINLGYRDPREIDPSTWEGREEEGILVVHNAGEMLYRAADLFGAEPSLATIVRAGAY